LIHAARRDGIRPEFLMKPVFQCENFVVCRMEKMRQLPPIDPAIK